MHMRPTPAARAFETLEQFRHSSLRHTNAKGSAMISAVIIYNQKAEVLISRLYRDGLRRTIADVFRIQVISNPEVS